MNHIHREKLSRLLMERRDRIESLRHFEEHYEMFIHHILRSILEEINMQLNEVTGDQLKLFFGDPYDEQKSRFFSMVQFIIGRRRNKEFYLDKSKLYPSLSFEGNEMNGKLLIKQKLQNSEVYEPIYETDMALIDESRISDILIEFIDKVYRM